MRKRMTKGLAVLLALLMCLIPGASAYGYLTEDGKTGEMIRLTRTVSSTSSMVGRVETIKYDITGDSIVYDPPKEIALVVDVSGSMDSDVNGKSKDEKRISMLKKAVKSFVEKWQNANCSICIVPFSTNVSKAPELIFMKDSDALTRLNAAISALKPDGWTNIGDGMRVAYQMLYNSENTDASKYIITLTDGEPNYYSCDVDRFGNNISNSYYTGPGVLPAKRALSNTTRGLEYCTTIIGGMILSNPKFKSFVIGFATPANLVNNLDKIGTDSGAAMVESTGKHFYYAGDQAQLNNVYSTISNIISNDTIIGGALFSELLPEGTIIDPAAVAAMEADGFTITNKDSLGISRILITKPLNEKLVLARKYPEANTSPKNRIYQLKPFSFTIRIVYTTPGIKVYESEDGCVTYTDPFKNLDDTAYSNRSGNINVIQPATDMLNTDMIVMPGQKEAPGVITAKVLPDTAPNIVYEKAISHWTVTSAKDVSGSIVGSPETIISLGNPDEPDPMNQIKTVTGLKPGTAYVEAVSVATNLSGSAIKGSSFVAVVDGRINDAIIMNKGDKLNLNGGGRTTIFIPNTNNDKVKGSYMSFQNWRTVNPGDAAYVIIDAASGDAEAVRALEHEIPIAADLHYNIPGFIHLTKTVTGMIRVGVPVNSVEVTGAVIMAGTQKKISANVTPADATNRKIKLWSLIDSEGNTVTHSSNVAELGEILDEENKSEVMVEAKEWGRLNVMAESEGLNSNGETVTGSNTIYVVDVICPAILTVTLWGTKTIEPEKELIPDGLGGSFTYEYESADPSAVSVNKHTGEVKGLKNGAVVEIKILARYVDRDGKDTGQTKKLTCKVTVGRPAIDIN